MPNGDVRKANLKMLLDRAKDYEKISFIWSMSAGACQL